MELIKMYSHSRTCLQCRLRMWATIGYTLSGVGMLAVYRSRELPESSLTQRGLRFKAIVLARVVLPFVRWRCQAAEKQLNGDFDGKAF